MLHHSSCWQKIIEISNYLIVIKLVKLLYIFQFYMLLVCINTYELVPWSLLFSTHACKQCCIYLNFNFNLQELLDAYPQKHGLLWKSFWNQLQPKSMSQWHLL